MNYWEEQEAEHKAYKAWLATIKVGDQVVTSKAGYEGRKSTSTIERLTDTQAVCANGKRFKRSDGRVIGDSYTKVEPVTQQVRDANELADLRGWICGIDHNRVRAISLATLRAMKQAHDETEAQQQKGGEP